MIYLCSRKLYSGFVHNFYCDGYLYYHNTNVDLYCCVKLEKRIYDMGMYSNCDSFQYVLPDKLNYTKYHGFGHRIKVMVDIMEQIIFENI